ncbi:MAG: hypothetical protein ACPGFB_11000 [Verrucomicrobiales bacterium]
MKLVVIFALLLPLSVFCDDGCRHVRILEQGNEASNYEWLPVSLTGPEIDLLNQRANPPSSALDFYLLLSRSYFGRVEDSLERRVSFIQKETLSPQFLHAEFTIPRVDAGAFFVTIRVFEGEDSPLVAIRHHDDYRLIYKRSIEGSDRLSYISVGFPEFWRFTGGAWIRANHDVLPRIETQSVLARYEGIYGAHLEHPNQTKWISLDYDLPAEGTFIKVVGRENYMSPQRQYIWARYEFDGRRFLEPVSSGEAGTLKP